MTPLTGAEITSIISAVTAPVTSNFLAIVTLMATVAGISLVFRYLKKGAK